MGFSKDKGRPSVIVLSGSFTFIGLSVTVNIENVRLHIDSKSVKDINEVKDGVMKKENIEKNAVVEEKIKKDNEEGTERKKETKGSKGSKENGMLNNLKTPPKDISSLLNNQIKSVKGSCPEHVSEEEIKFFLSGNPAQHEIESQIEKWWEEYEKKIENSDAYVKDKHKEKVTLSNNVEENSESINKEKFTSAINVKGKSAGNKTQSHNTTSVNNNNSTLYSELLLFHEKNYDRSEVVGKSEGEWKMVKEGEKSVCDSLSIKSEEGSHQGGIREGVSAICLDFLNGKCIRGNRCRFSHSNEEEKKFSSNKPSDPDVLCYGDWICPNKSKFNIYAHTFVC